MRPKLLQLPLDILNTILQELMPSFRQEFDATSPHDWDNMRNLPVPLDLCRLLAVCRAFHELASPWVWRRVAICLRYEDVETNTGHHWPRTYERTERGKIVPGQWNYLRDHPEAASHIRLLTLDIRKTATWQPGVLTAFQAVMSFMTKLQVLRLRCDHCETNTTLIDPIYFGLVSKQPLRRIIVSEYTPSELSWNFPATIDLTHVKVQGWTSRYEHLLLAAPRLQSLEMAAERGTVVYLWEVGSSWKTLSIPWGTLRTITLKDFPDCFQVFHNLESWKRSLPTRSSPLSEVTIDISEPLIPPEDIDLLARCGQDLIALHLGTMACNNGGYETFFNRISASFPHLQNLAIFFDSNEAYAWTAKLSSVSDFLKKLPLLKSLDWNYFDEEHDMYGHLDDEDGLPDYSASEDSFHRTMCVIRPNFPALERVGFHQPSYYASHEIMRDDMGNDMGEMVVELSKDESPELFMSYWDDQMYDSI